jgi:transposase InsO family protein
MVVVGDSRKRDHETIRFPHRVSKSRIKTVSIFPLISRNYKVSATIGLSTKVATTVRAILDTGAGPNLVKESVLPEDWERHRIVGDTDYRIVGAGGRRLNHRGMLVLYVELGHLRVKAQFIVVAGLAADCILGCQFIDRHVRTITPKDKRVTLSDESIIPILRDHDPLQPPVRNPASPTVSTKLRVARRVVIPPRTEHLVWVQCAAPGLRFIQASPKPNGAGLYLANGVAEILPHIPFPVRVMNTSLRERTLPKNMVLGNALPSPVGIVSLATEVANPEGYAPHTEIETSKANSPPPIARPYPPELDRCRPSPSLAGTAPMLDEPVGFVPPIADRPDMEGELWKEDVDLNHLLPQQRSEVFRALEKHRSMWDGRLGQIHGTTHRIDLTPGAKPFHSRPYRAGPRAREAETAEIQRMLKEGVIEATQSEWASPVVLVPKPDGSMRFCIDYRKLNQLTVRDAYPLPRMDECIDSLGEAKVFSTLDCNCGYWQIPVDSADQDKTTFTSHEGLFRFKRMPFGLMNAPATFQRVVDMTLSGLNWKICLVYLDDIIVFSPSYEEHIRDLDIVLGRLYGAGLSLKLKKCFFFKETVNYLGHVIQPGKLAVATKNTEALKHAKAPTTLTELRSFLGLCNVYRRFVPSFARIAAPLNALLRKGESRSEFAFTELQHEAFDSLREKLLHPPILALPRAAGQFVLDTDASQEQIGCCLFQQNPVDVEDGKDIRPTGKELVRRPIGYWSRSLTSAERNYSTTEKECLAIVWAILQLRPYLEGKRFIVRTDHNSLRWVLNLSDAQGRLARWRLRLLEFDFEVQYSPGKEHHAADTMSRLRSPDTSIPKEPVDTEIPCFAVRKDAVAAGDLLAKQVYLFTDPSPFLIQDLRAIQHGWFPDGIPSDDHTIDVDEFGIVGNVLSSGEFLPLLPKSLTKSAPFEEVVAYQDSCLRREDAPVLRRGIYKVTPRAEGEIFNASLAQRDTAPLPRALQLEELLVEQATDPECQAAMAITGQATVFDVNPSGLIIRIAPIDGVQQILVPASLRPRLLHLEHFPRTAGHPGVTRMYRSLRRRYFWQKMSHDVTDTVRSCTTCAKNRIKERKRTSFLKLFPASEPLEYLSMDILGPLPKTPHGNRFLLVITDRFSKLTRTIPLRTITAHSVAEAFCTHWVFAYGPPRYLLTDNGAQFTAKFFLAVCVELGIDKVFTTAYHPQTNGQVERFNRTIVNALRGYVSNHQSDWDEFTAALTYGYNTRIHSSLGLAPFELVLSRPPPPLSMETPEPGNDNPTREFPESAKLRFLARLRGLMPLARQQLADAQERYKKNFDRTVREKNNELSVGDWCYLRKEEYPLGVNPKLTDQVTGPYEIVETDGRTFSLRMDDRVEQVTSDRVTPAPKPQILRQEVQPTVEDDQPQSGERDSSEDGKIIHEPEYVFEKICGAKKLRDGELRYKVRWYGYSSEEDSWEPASHLPKDAIKRYHRKTGLPYQA